MAKTNQNTNAIQKYYLHLQKSFIKWANTEVDIRTAIVVGSRSRTDHLPDEWSDLDIMIYAVNPEQFLKDSSWLNEVGDVWIAVLSRTAGNDPEILVTFAGGFNVDFVFNPLDQLIGMVQDHIIPSGHLRGAKIILDKDGHAAQTLPDVNSAPKGQMPDPNRLNWITNAFWYTAYYLARQLRRGDLVMYQMRDQDLKRCLVQMMEWHTLSRNPQADTWHMGRFMEEWADPRAWKEYQATYAPSELDACWQALITSVSLFHWLSKETADTLHVPFPVEIDQRITTLVNELRNGNHLTPPKR